MPILILLLLLSACSTSRDSTRPVYKNTAPLLPGMTANEEISKKAESASVPTPEEETTHFEEAIVDQPSEPGIDEEEVEIRPKKNLKKSAIPHQFNEKVAWWIQYFSQKDRERFQIFLDRGEPYREAVENILEENKVPADLYYLGLIESGFNYKASSKVKAVGVWQFMKPTGKHYGLGVDSYIDERRDPIRATEAAARYLRDLYREFGSWYLAMAAYNAGPGRIRGCIRRAGTDDFWELVNKRKLPRETMEYIPKFLAARYIGENPDLFAFYINDEKKFPDVELVTVPSPVWFKDIESKIGMPAGTLSFVNPHYVRHFTHPAKSTDEIWVPEKFANQVTNSFRTLASFRTKIRPEKVAVAAAPRSKINVHIVKKGDTLTSIAKKQGLSVAYLRRMNNLSSRGRLVVGQKLKLSASSYRQTKTHPRQQRRNKRR